MEPIAGEAGSAPQKKKEDMAGAGPGSAVGRLVRLHSHHPIHGIRSRDKSRLANRLLSSHGTDVLHRCHSCREGASLEILALPETKV